MKIYTRIIAFVWCLTSGLSAYAQAQPAKLTGSSVKVTLKEAFKGAFYAGVAINRRQIQGADTKGRELIATQFNSISPENDLKWSSIHPKKEAYNFKPADDYVDFGLKNRMFIVGHTLVWHQQTPAWVYNSESGNKLSRDELLKVMEDHITTVVGRYKGKIGGWDVVNEAFNDNGTFRKSDWHDIIGDDFIEKAFEFAHKADPKAELYYNDYNLYVPKKREAVVSLIKRLQAKNIPVTAVGEQGHYGLNSPAVNQVEASIIAFTATGASVNITELDINVLPNANQQINADLGNTADYQAKYNPYAAGLPDTIATQLANRYAALFAMFYKHKAVISRVTFWGLTDGDSWLNGWPIRGRTNYPLLFDRAYNIKQPVFDAVVKVAGR
ncbi:endo-1,4-beta-xylanase [Mucilaginibacter antarcticus]|uniref:Beta-xylanase n=1 Tax=Mucilaginibacter antarcticus TaxID=1855725 RepID=A0ABW5XUZ0_9SPHI